MSHQRSTQSRSQDRGARRGRLQPRLLAPRSSRSRSPASWPRRWTPTGPRRCRRSTSRTSTRSASRARTTSGSRATSARSRRSCPAYLLEHARRHDYALLTRPEVTLETDDRLRLGEFGIQTAARQAARPPGRAAVAGRGRATRWSTRLRAEAEEEPRSRGAPAGRDPRDRLARRPPLRARGPDASLGRSRECDCVFRDPNVSRRHAELRRGSTGDWQIVDLGSTNGVKVNGRRVDTSRLSPGDDVTLGHDAVRVRHRAIAQPAARSSVEADPVAVALKFGFLAVLYLFLFWVARSALKELRGDDARRRPRRPGFTPCRRQRREPAPTRGWSSVTGGGLDAGRALRPLRRRDDRPLGRGRRADRGPLRVADPLPRLLSRRHLLRRGHELDQRDLPERRPARRRGRRCSDMDEIQIGDTEFRFELEDRPGSADAAGRRAGTPTDTGRQRQANEDASSRARRCSRSPTAWAARRPARSPRRSPPRRSRRPTPATRPRSTTCARRRGRQRADPRARPGGRLALGDGDDADRGPDPRRRDQLRPRRRQPRLRLPRRRAQAADQRPLARRGAAPPGPAHRRPGRGAPAALDHHPRAGPRARRRGRHDDLSGARPATSSCSAPTGSRRCSRRGADRADPRAAHEPRLGRRRGWSTRPTSAAAATTSPSSCSGSRTRREVAAREQATLIGARGRGGGPDRRRVAPRAPARAGAAAAAPRRRGRRWPRRLARRPGRPADRRRARRRRLVRRRQV